MNAVETVTRALTLATARAHGAPNFELFTSSVAQLTYLLAVLNGEELDRSRLKQIIVGHFAVREFEESDPEFAAALVDSQSIASRLSKGLKL